MSRFGWLRSCFRRNFLHQNKKRNSRRDRLGFVQLEDRVVPSYLLPVSVTGQQTGNDSSDNFTAGNHTVSDDGRFTVFRSAASNLVPGDTNGVPDIFLYDSVIGITSRISVDSAGGQGNGESYYPSITPDGRFAVFTSAASNLVMNDSNGTWDVFVRDLVANTTKQVSVTSDGLGGDNGSYYPTISADGRMVAFTSLATNLVPGFNAGGFLSVFVKNLSTGVITEVSQGLGGVPPNDGSDQAVISADGLTVVFSSGASNLVAADTNGWGDVFIRNLTSGTTTLVSVATNGDQGNYYSYNPTINADGTIVAFSSGAVNLVAGDTNDRGDVFVRNLTLGTTTRISAGTDGTEGNGTSEHPSLSADGTVIAFISAATNLVPGDINSVKDVFHRNLLTGTTSRLSLAADGSQANNQSSYLSLSPNGKVIAFTSNASNLVTGDSNNFTDVFLRNISAGTTTLVSGLRPTGNNSSDNTSSGQHTVSADGRYIAFSSDATNLVQGDTNFARDVFVYDRVTKTITLVSVASNGTQGNSSSFAPSISADGKRVAFYSIAFNLIDGDTNNLADVFVRDLATGTTTRVSVAPDGSQGNDSSFNSSISADGKVVAFQSYASNLAIGDTNNSSDIFIRDFATGTTTRVSVASDGTQGNSNSDNPSISADGKVVTFQSYASNLVAGDTNGTWDVFVRDLATGTTTRVSVASDGTQANANSERPSISADGKVVAYYSIASNLVPGDTNNTSDVFVWNLTTGTTTRASIASDGTQGNANSGTTSISADGKVVAFFSNASNVVTGDINGTWDVYVRDLAVGTTTRVSVATDGTQGNSTSYLPSISADGKVVAFQSNASNLAAGDTNSTYDVFVVVLTSSASLSASLSGSQVTVSDTIGTDNALTIRLIGSDLVIADAVEQFTAAPMGWTLSADGKSISIPAASFVGAITVNGGGGNDTLTIDLSGGAIPNAITFNGETQTSATGDRLILNGSGTYSSVTHTLINANDGTVAISGGTSLISYTGLEPVVDNLTVSFRTFNFTGAAETITLSDSGGADGQMTLDSSLSVAVEFANPTQLLNIFTQNATGTDSFQFQSLDAAFAATIQVMGDADDVATLNAVGAYAFGRDLSITSGTVIVAAPQSTFGNGRIQLLSAGDIQVNATLTTTNGVIRLDADTNGDGIGTVTLAPGSTGGIVTSGAGLVFVSGSDIDLQNTISTTNSVTLYASPSPGTNGRPITLGANVAGTVSLSDMELDWVSTGALVIGDPNTGEITLAGTIDRASFTNMTIRNKRDIILSDGMLSIGGGTLTFVPGATGAVRPIGNSAVVSAELVSFASGADLLININSEGNYDHLTVNGTVDLSGVDLQLAGAYVPIHNNIFDFVIAYSRYGIFNDFPDHNTVLFNGKILTATYTPTRVRLFALSLAPIANPGGPYPISAGQDLSLDASDSSDPDPWDSLSYAWDLNNDGLYDVTSAQPMFVVPWTTLTSYIGSSGIFTISLRVTDTYGLNSTATTTTLTINSSPIVGANNPTVSIAEGGTATNTGTFDDTDGRGTVTLTTSIGTLSRNDTLGTWNWSLPTTDNTSGFVSVVITATDDQGAIAFTSFTYTVTNTPPALTTQWSQGGGLEGFPITNQITVSDVSADSVVLTASLGQLESLRSGIWRWRLLSADDLAPTNVTITATDDDGGISTTKFNVNVANADPTTTIVGAPSTSPQYSVVTLGSTVTDPGADTFTYAWSVTRNGILYASGRENSLSFTPLSTGLYTVQLTVTDDDGGMGVVAKSITVTAAPAPTPNRFQYEVSLAVNGTVFFKAGDTTHGDELWAYDVTSGARLVRDINPGVNYSSPSGFLGVGSKVYFTANDGTHGYELWVSDGTTEGTKSLADIRPGLGHFTPTNLVAWGNQLHFVNSITGQHWLTDGTSAGTLPMTVSPAPNGFVQAFGSFLYYLAYEPVHGQQLWRSDGTIAGTNRVTSNLPQVPIGPVKVSGSHLYLIAGDSEVTTDYQIWTTDGASDATMIFDMPLLYGQPYGFIAAGSITFFVAWDAEHGTELWVTDGTEGGTSVIDLVAGPQSMNLGSFTSDESLLYFTAERNGIGSQVFVSDGTAAGTRPFVDNVFVSAGGWQGQLTKIGSALFFQADDGIHGVELWQSNGTVAGTGPVQDRFPGSTGSNPFLLGVAGDHLLVAVDSTSGRELWSPSALVNVTLFGIEGTVTDADDTRVIWNVASDLILTNVLVSVTQDGQEVYASNNPSSFVELYQFGPGEYFVEVTATNSAGRTALANRSITVIDDDATPPTIILGGSLGTESHSLTQHFTWEVSDTTGLGIVIVSITRDGEEIFISDAADGNFNFDGHGVGTYTFNVTAADADDEWVGDASVATVVRTVVVTNDAPTAADLSVTTAEDVAVIGQVTGGDADGDSLTFALVNGPTFGSIVFHADGTFLYTPDANYYGSDAFTFVVLDSEFASGEGIVAVTITPVNDTPTATPASFNIFEGESLTDTLIGFDPDGDPVTYLLVDGPLHGTVEILTDGTFNYTSVDGYSGPDLFTFQVNDGTEFSDSASVTMSITAVNHTPTGIGQTLATFEDTPLTGAVAATDPDDDPLIFSLFNGPANGQLTFTVNGEFTYIPGPNFHGTDSFSFVADDGSGPSEPATVTISVTAVNDAPFAMGDFLELPDSGEGEIVLLGTDLETSAENLIFTISSVPSRGVLLNTFGQVIQVGDTYIGSPTTLTYQLIFAFGQMTDSFSYRVRDTGDPDGVGSNALTSAVATVSLALPTGSAGVMRIGGLDEVDNFQFDVVSGNVRIRNNGVSSIAGITIPTNIPLASVDQIRVFERGGNDEATWTGVAKPIFVDGGNGIDTLTVTGTNGADTFLLNPSDVTVNGIILSRSGVEQLVLLGLAGNNQLTLTSPTPNAYFVFSGSGSADAASGTNTGLNWRIIGANTTDVVAGGVTIGQLQAVENLAGGTGDDTYELAGGSLNGSIGDLGGVDTLTYLGVSAPSAAVNIQSRTASLIGGTIPASLEVVEGNGFGVLSTLTGLNIASTWSVTGPNSGTVGSVTFRQFSGLIGGNSTDVFTFAPGGFLTGTINGGSGTDTITGDDDTNEFVLTGTATGIFTGRTGSFTSIETVAGNGGYDIVRFNAASPVTVNLATQSTSGGVSTSFSTMEKVVGTSGLDTLTLASFSTPSVWTVSGIGGGSVVSDPAGSPFAIDFDGFENLTTGTAADTFMFTAGGYLGAGLINAGNGMDFIVGPDADTIWSITGANNAGRLSDVGTGLSRGSFANVESLSGGSGNDTYAFAAARSVSGTIAGGVGTDMLDYSAYTTTVAINLATMSVTGIFGGASNGFAGIELMKGGTAADTLTGSNTVNNWSVTGLNAGTVGAYSFFGIENLTGGTGSDTFTLAKGVALSGKVAGGAGIDKLDYNAYTTAVSVNLATSSATGLFGGAANGFTGIENFTGGFATDTLSGPNTMNTWSVIANTLNGTIGFTGFEVMAGGTGADTFLTSASTGFSGTFDGGGGTADKLTITDGDGNAWAITSPNAGTLNGMNFRNIENLTGGIGSDDFAFTAGGSISGKIDGGGAGILRFAFSITANLQTGSVTGVVGTFANISGFVGNGVSDTVIGSNVTNTWNLYDANGNAAVNGIGIYGFESLVGGSGNDNYIFGNGAKTGLINGGPGTNTLDYSAYLSSITVNFALTTPTALGTGGVTNVLNVIGGAGDDLMVGNSGANVFIGNAGRDCIIGGGGGDTLSGGAGDDIVIAGTTSYDTTPAALTAIRDYWARTDLSYTQRIAGLTAGIPSSAGTIRLTATTVQNDNISDSLTGGADLDWFFARTTGSNSSKDAVLDKDPLETLTPI
jgi:ELWxxDGT repeat protein